MDYCLSTIHTVGHCEEHSDEAISFSRNVECKEDLPPTTADNAVEFWELRHFQVDLFRYVRYQECTNPSVKSHYWRDNLNVVFAVIRYVDICMFEIFLLIIR